MNFSQRIKQMLLARLRGQDGALERLLAGHRETGFVTWNATAPPMVAWLTHKFSIMEAIETASNFALTDYAGETEWLYVGEKARVIIMTLPLFVMEAPNAQGLFSRERRGVRMGVVGRWPVIFVRGLADTLVLMNSGQGNAVRIQIVGLTA